ncbi:MAG: DUF488 domain-containing protein [Chloroflexota bacterium]
MSRAFTIGHSNHSIERFVEFLEAYGIDVVADVRSTPTSRYSPQFAADALARSLSTIGLRYAFLGRQLGGRPTDPALYDEEGHVLYGLLSRSPAFVEGIERLVRGVEGNRVAVMCGEEDPTSCHRRRLIGRVLRERGVEVIHIRADGRLQSETEVEREEQLRFPGRFQLRLLSIDGGWRSTKPVSQRPRVMP